MSIAIRRYSCKPDNLSVAHTNTLFCIQSYKLLTKLCTAADKNYQSLRTVCKSVSQLLTEELEKEQQKQADRTRHELRFDCTSG